MTHLAPAAALDQQHAAAKGEEEQAGGFGNDVATKVSWMLPSMLVPLPLLLVGMRKKVLL